jgi:hypothetical protein
VLALALQVWAFHEMHRAREAHRSYSTLTNLENTRKQ